uniref:Unkown protein n=1 Tax=Riptortus pedestris TaxID=329032 RepID=R4WJ39_RIPPE|nr:unkown protein [Riptortus pedestris]
MSGYDAYGRPIQDDPVCMASPAHTVDPGAFPAQPAFPAQRVVYTVAVFGPDPSNTNCPNCQVQVTTAVQVKDSIAAYALGTFIALAGCFCGCCLIPCHMEVFKIYEHKCPRCNAYLGKYSRSPF